MASLLSAPDGAVCLYLLLSHTHGGETAMSWRQIREEEEEEVGRSSSPDVLGAVESVLRTEQALIFQTAL